MEQIQNNEADRIDRHGILFGGDEERDADLWAELDQMEAKEIGEQMEKEIKAPVAHEKVVVNPVPNSLAVTNQKLHNNQDNLNDIVQEGPVNDVDQPSMMAL